MWSLGIAYWEPVRLRKKQVKKRRTNIWPVRKPPQLVRIRRKLSWQTSALQRSQLRSSGQICKGKREKLGAYATKRVAAGAHVRLLGFLSYHQKNTFRRYAKSGEMGKKHITMSVENNRNDLRLTLLWFTVAPHFRTILWKPGKKVSYLC